MFPGLSLFGLPVCTSTQSMVPTCQAQNQQPNSSNAPSYPLKKRAPSSKRAKKDGISTTPEALKLELLQRELNLAQSKITLLDSQVSEEKNKTKILEDRIRCFEHRENQTQFARVFGSSTYCPANSSTSAYSPASASTSGSNTNHASSPDTPPVSSPVPPPASSSCCKNSGVILVEFACLKNQIRIMQESLGLLLSRPQPQNNGASNPQHSDCPPAQPSSAPSSPTPTESSPDEQNPNLSSQTESSPSPPPSTRPSVPQPGASHIQATNSASDTLPDPLIPPPVQQTSLHSEPPDGDTGTRDTDAAMNILVMVRLV